jgi:type I restriction enzyme S subunit
VTFRTARLSEICDINPKMPKSLDDRALASFLPMAAVSEEGRIVFEEERTVAEVKKGYTYFERGDVLVAKITPCFENGKASRTISLSKPFGFGSTEFHVLRAANDVVPDFLFYKIWNSSFRELGAQNMTGSAGQKRVPADFLKRLEICLPPLDEQRRIVAVLDKANALHRKGQRVVHLFNSLTQSIFLKMFDPNSYRSIALEELTNLKRGPFGGALKKEIFVESGFLVYEQGTVISGDPSSGRYFVDQKKYSTMKDFSVQPDDILITCSGTLGAVLRVQSDFPEGIINQALLRVRPDVRRIRPQFLETFLTLDSSQAFFEAFARGTGLKNFPPMPEVRAMPIPLVSIDIQDEFLVKKRRVEKYFAEATRSASRFCKLFSSLQSRAFAGQL